MVGLKPNMEMDSFSSDDFLCASKFLFFAFTSQGPFTNPNLDEVFQLRPYLRLFLILKTLN